MHFQFLLLSGVVPWGGGANAKAESDHSARYRVLLQPEYLLHPWQRCDVHGPFTERERLRRSHSIISFASTDDALRALFWYGVS
jgi:hypothetical protein